MIKFFRQIRQRLLTENRFRKYLFYAVGEIFLVVIGILIALQINNWNEKRKAREETEKLLVLLISDLQKDLVYFTELKAEYNGWLEQIHNILENSLGHDNRITEHVNFAAGRSSMNFLHVTKTTFDEMFGSSKRLQFNNHLLSRDIKDYFQHTEIELHKLNSDNEYFFQHLLNTYGEWGISIWQRLYWKRNLEYIDWKWLNDPNSWEYKRIESINLYYKLAILTNIKAIDDMAERSRDLIEEIEVELR